MSQIGAQLVAGYEGIGVGYAIYFAFLALRYRYRTTRMILLSLLGLWPLVLWLVSRAAFREDRNWGT